jgi:hypothetical protein
MVCGFACAHIWTLWKLKIPSRVNIASSVNNSFNRNCGFRTHCSRNHWQNVTRRSKSSSLRPYTIDTIPNMLTRLLKLHPRTGQEGLAVATLPIKRNTVLTVQGDGWAQGVVWTCAENLGGPHHQACSESLYPWHEGVQGFVEVHLHSELSIRGMSVFTLKPRSL